MPTTSPPPTYRVLPMQKMSGSRGSPWTTHPTRCHISEDLNPQLHCCANLKSHRIFSLHGQLEESLFSAGLSIVKHTNTHTPELCTGFIAVSNFSCLHCQRNFLIILTFRIERRSVTAHTATETRQQISVQTRTTKTSKKYTVTDIYTFFICNVLTDAIRK